MKAGESAPLSISCHLEIAADQLVVWDVLTNFQDWPSWDPKIKSVTLEGPVAADTVFHWKTGFSSITSMLRLVDRPRAISWTGKTFGVHASHLYELEGSDSGTVVTTVESWNGPLVNLLRVPIARMLGDSLRAGLGHLKAESERRVASSRL